MKKIFINIVIGITVFLFLFILLEATLRIYYWLKPIFTDKIEFSKEEKTSDKTFNIYYFGESTMYGEPFSDALSIPKLVNYMLDYKIAGKDIRYINLAKQGRDLGFNLDALKQILKKRDMAHPSLCVIYCGHNEFLKYQFSFKFDNPLIKNNRIIRSIAENSYLVWTIMNRITPKAYILDIDERAFFDYSPFGRKDKISTINKYKVEIMDFIALLRKNNIPCIISTVAGNYSDWEPNRSVFCNDGSEKTEFKQFMDKGNELQSKLMFAEAIEEYLNALSFCGGFAETYYRLGKCYEALGDYEKAWQEYREAVNNDGMPIRATEEQNNFIKSLQEDSIVFTVDAVKCLRENAQGGVVGYNFMIDGHHPNLKGYILISQLIAQKIKQIFHEKEPIRLLSENEAKEKFSIGQAKMFEVYISRGRWLTRVATWRYDPSERLKRAELCFSQAMSIDDHRYEPYLGLAMCNFLRKNSSLGEKYLAQAKEKDPEAVRKYLKESWVNNVIKRAYL